MSQDIILLSSSILIGYSNAFQIANFLSSFIPQEPTLSNPEAFPYPNQLTENEHRRISSNQLTLSTGDQLTERQGGGATAITILVVFIIAFATSVLTNLIFISVVTGGAGAGEEEEWEWCYDDPSCDQDAWKTQAPFMCNGIRNSPIDVDFGGLTEEAEGDAFMDPLTFTNYASVRYIGVGNVPEHEDGIDPLFALVDPYARAKKLSNKGGHTAQIDVEYPPDAGVGELTGGPLTVPYQILQLHFHWGDGADPGSEHTYGGTQYPLEMHIVHVKSGLPSPALENFAKYSDGLAVTGFMFNVGATNDELDPLILALEKITEYGESIEFPPTGVTFDLNALIAPAIGSGNRYATYEGGLTTPTCNEVVRWINMETPLTLSAAQLAIFRTLLDKNGNNIVNNFRSVQDLGGRTVRVIAPA